MEIDSLKAQASSLLGGLLNKATPELTEDFQNDLAYYTSYLGSLEETLNSIFNGPMNDPEVLINVVGPGITTGRRIAQTLFLKAPENSVIKSILRSHACEKEYVPLWDQISSHLQSDADGTIVYRCVRGILSLMKISTERAWSLNDKSD